MKRVQLKNKMWLINNKKSQAALEFLTTYAWAFLVIIITIGALAYFGVLNPSNLLPDRCNFGSEIACLQYVVKENGLQLKLNNNAGTTIIVNSVAVSSGKSNLDCVYSIDNPLWEAGIIKDVAIPCIGLSDAGIVEGNKEKFNLEIKYSPAQSSYDKTVSGEVFGLVGKDHLDNTLQGYWKFDEGSGSIAKDYWGNDGTLNAGGSGSNIVPDDMWDIGQFSKALEFDGTDDYVDTGANYLDSHQSGTVSFWVKLDSFSPIPVVWSYSRRDDNSHYTYFAIRDDNSADIFYNYGLGATSSSWANANIVTGSWYHVAITSDGLSYRLYVNGENKGSPTSNNNGDWFGDQSSGTESFNIGALVRISTGNVVDGIIDEFKIYSRQLSDLEIQALAGVII